ncbi:Predicted dehydrogenase [Lachnospiraceae bacterium]|nr:Predicted dehydrogenase [Lachnospiraceae bacterium]
MNGIIKKIVNKLTEKDIRLGVIGTGRIAERFVQSVGDVKFLEVTAVYNVRRKSAERFAKLQGLKNAFDDIEEFLSAVDAVYIASPHETHVGYARTALEHGKHVLCEKPISFSKSDAEELYSLAEEKGLILLEALKTAYCEGFHKMMEEAHSGHIGAVRDIEAAFTKLEGKNTRELTDLKYGGSFLELGSYNMLPVFRIYGTDYKDVHFYSTYAENGLDLYTKAVFDYGDGRFATAKCGLGVKSEGQILISGTDGYILGDAPWWLTKRFSVRYEDPNRQEKHEASFEGSGLQYEAGAFVRHIRSLVRDDSSSEAERRVLKKESIARSAVMEQFLAENAERRGKVQKAIDEMPPVRVWAHRGMSMEYPENTLEAFKAAAELGNALTGIETDIQLSKDGEVVVFHDETLDRVTVDGKGNLRDYTLDELKRIKIDKRDGSYTEIPTLDETLELLKPYMEKNGLLLNIELKTSVYRYEGLEEKALEIVRRHGVEKYIVWSSFLMESIKHMKELDPKAKTGMLAGSLAACVKGADEANAEALHPSCYCLDTEVPERFKGGDHAVRAWGGQEPLFIQGADARLVEKNMTRFARNGVTDIITNVPDRYVETKKEA